MFGAVACATTPAPPPGGPPQAGASCEGDWSVPTDGVAIVPFAGTVYGWTEGGERRPLEGARFVVVAGAPHGSLSFLTDPEGRFQGKMILPTHATRECRDGVVKAGYVVGSATISVRAKGCKDTVIAVDARWEPRSIDLRCGE